MISGKHFKAHEVSCCIKYFIFGFNIIFWVSPVRSLQACCWSVTPTTPHMSLSVVSPPSPSLGGLFLVLSLIVTGWNRRTDDIIPPPTRRGIAVHLPPADSRQLAFVSASAQRCRVSATVTVTVKVRHIYHSGTFFSPTLSWFDDNVIGTIATVNFPPWIAQ